MPISTEVDEHRRLITRTLTDPVAFDDLRAEIDRQWADQTWTYAMLYDARALSVPVTLNDLRRLSDHADLVSSGRPRGPMGIVIAPRAELIRSGIEYGADGGRSRDLEVLMSQGQVDAWLARNATRRPRLNS
jgi:hypothetical protein